MSLDVRAPLLVISYWFDVADDQTDRMSFIMGWRQLTDQSLLTQVLLVVWTTKQYSLGPLVHRCSCRLHLHRTKPLPWPAGDTITSGCLSVFPLTWCGSLGSPHLSSESRWGKRGLQQRGSEILCEFVPPPEGKLTPVWDDIRSQSRFNLWQSEFSVIQGKFGSFVWLAGKCRYGSACQRRWFSLICVLLVRTQEEK